MTDDLDDLIRELETVAGQLRSEQLEPAEAAELVERCAELAGRVGGALRGTAEGQERLL